jgi:putative nucleotidyltransferase with HDIG domain
LVLSHEIAEVFPGKQLSGFSLEDHEKHALFVASIARKLVRDRVRGDEAFIAAMLHDVGNLMLASRAPDQFSKVVKTALERNVPQYVIERETLGITHAEVGAYLLGLWGIPFTITEAVANHHSPSTVPAASPADDVLVSVHVANALAHELTDGELVHQSLLDEDFLTRIGMIDELPRWRAIATEQYERVRDVISS